MAWADSVEEDESDALIINKGIVEFDTDKDGARKREKRQTWHCQL